MSLAAAIITAAVFAVFGFPFRYYQCWYSWNWIGTNLGVLLYLILAGGGGGLLGWFVGELGQANPSDNLAINGLFYGVAGALVLRASFQPTRRTTTRAPNQTAADTASALGYGITWTTGLLDEVARRSATNWFKNLPDADLVLQAVEVSVDIENQPGTQMKPAAKKQLLTRIAEATEKVAHPDTPQIRAEGRAQITAFCVDYCIGTHLVKPSPAATGHPAPATP